MAKVDTSCHVVVDAGAVVEPDVPEVAGVLQGDHVAVARDGEGGHAVVERWSMPVPSLSRMSRR